MDKLKLITINKLSDINKIKKEWLDLLNNFSSNNIYCDPDFYKYAFESRANNGTPHIVLFQLCNKPIAILVGWKNTINIPLWLGYFKFQSPKLESLEIEINGLLTDGNHKSKRIILDYLNSLISEKEIDLLIANHFSSKNIFYNELKNGLATNRNAVYKPGLEWTTIIRDAKTGKKENIHSSRTSQTFRRKDRKILKYFNEELEVKLVETPNQINFFLENAEKVSKKNYHLALGVGIKNNEYWHNNFVSMSKGGYFRGYLLMAGSLPIAYYQGIVYKDIFYAVTTSYDSDYRNLSPGSYLLRQVIDHSEKQNINIFHFGYGDAEHKQLYGNSAVSESSFKIYGNTLSSGFTRSLDFTTIFINKKIIEYLESKGLLNKVKKIWRKVLSKK